MSDIKIGHALSDMLQYNAELQRRYQLNQLPSNFSTFCQLVSTNYTLASRIWDQRRSGGNLMDAVFHSVSTSPSLDDFIVLLHDGGGGQDTDVVAFHDAFVALDVLQKLYTSTFRDYYEGFLHPKQQQNTKPQQPRATSSTMYAAGTDESGYFQLIQQALDDIGRQMGLMSLSFQEFQKYIGTTANSQERKLDDLTNGLIGIYDELWKAKKAVDSAQQAAVSNGGSTNAQEQVNNLSKVIHHARRSTAGLLAQLDVKEIEITEEATKMDDRWTAAYDEDTQRSEQHNRVSRVLEPGFERMSSKRIVRAPTVVRLVHRI